eukprot:TRINITY_DN44794_c0_g1_i1.p1 TRINITY_DN44794_c0_g1~~TRINITY_DN44794_c0_g1_i1.p1  ORF type:complete len:153 (+),score=26.27 TRINITY_DN44794_c0_g1_i1:86-544(+)
MASRSEITWTALQVKNTFLHLVDFPLDGPVLRRASSDSSVTYSSCSSTASSQQSTPKSSFFGELSPPAWRVQVSSAPGLVEEGCDGLLEVKKGKTSMKPKYRPGKRRRDRIKELLSTREGAAYAEWLIMNRTSPIDAPSRMQVYFAKLQLGR